MTEFTPNRNYPLVHPHNSAYEDAGRLRTALGMIDADVQDAVDASQQALNEVYVAIENAVNDLLGGAPEALNTLAELAAALGDDPNFATTVVDALDDLETGKADAVHGHAISDVTGLQSALDGKAASAHNHTISDVTGLQSALDAKANTNSLGTAATQNVGTEPNNVVQLDGAGKLPAVDGSQLTNITAAVGVSGVSRNLYITRPSNSTLSVAADECSVTKPTGEPRIIGIDATLNVATTGANGLDTGTIAANTEYHLWAIYNGSTAAVLASTSKTNPSLPGGYTYKGYIGAFFTDGSANIIDFTQRGKSAQYKTSRALASGAATWPVSASVTGLIPTTASVGVFNVLTHNNRVRLGANNGFAACDADMSGLNTQVIRVVDLVLEGSSVYWGSSSSGGSISVIGWRYP